MMLKEQTPISSRYITKHRTRSVWPIRTMADYNAAVAVVDRLAVKGEVNLSPAESDRLAIFTTLIEDWDRRHYEAELSQSNGLVETLKALMNDHGMSASDLGRLLGNRALGSKILRGERGLSQTHIRRLADHFHVSPALFL